PDAAVLAAAMGHDKKELAETLTATDAGAAALVTFVAKHALEDRDLSLNVMGRKFVLPLWNPMEGFGAEGASPATWHAFKPPFRIVEAWQLVESIRITKPVAECFIAIFDDGFYLDPFGVPLVDDWGHEMFWVNRMPGQIGDPGSDSSYRWHGNSVASVA